MSRDTVFIKTNILQNTRLGNGEIIDITIANSVIHKGTLRIENDKLTWYNGKYDRIGKKISWDNFIKLIKNN